MRINPEIFTSVLASFALSACIAVAPPALAADTAAAPEGACHKVAEVQPVFFPTVEIAAFDFFGKDAAQLGAAVDFLSGDYGMARVASTLHIVVVPEKAEFDVFSFDADGCSTSIVSGLDYEAIEHVFRVADVRPPDKLAFYQQPWIAI